MSTENPTEGRRPDRTAVALPLTRFMRAAWIGGFASGMDTALAGSNITDGECDAIIEAMMSRLDTEPALISAVTQEVDDLVLSLLTQDGAVSTVTSEGPQAGSEEAALLSEAVRGLMLNKGGAQ